jgi:hypothetical protein
MGLCILIIPYSPERRRLRILLVSQSLDAGGVDILSGVPSSRRDALCRIPPALKGGITTNRAFQAGYIFRWLIMTK